MRRHSPIECKLCHKRYRLAGERHPGRSPGFYRKHHPLDCGVPQCGTCHGDKVVGREPFRDRRSRLTLREGLDEIPTRFIA